MPLVASSEACLVLEDGTEFRGTSRGFPASVSGEVVFNTGMVGYTEALTDPSYRGQILVLTYPLVGNYGVPPDFESENIHAAALIVSDLATHYSHVRAQMGLAEWLYAEGIPCLAGIDTRALTKRLRRQGCMRGRVLFPESELFEEEKGNPVAAVSSHGRVVYEGGRKTVVLVDCGAKASIVAGTASQRSAPKKPRHPSQK